MDPNRQKMLSEQLTRLTTRRSQQDTLLWQVFAVFAGGNGALVLWLFDKTLLQGLVASFMGAVICKLWFCIQQRILLQIVRCEMVAGLIERKLEITDWSLPPNTSLLNADQKQHLQSFDNTESVRTLMPRTAKSACWLWILAAIIYALLSLRTASLC
jgi:hypothetical protein